MNILIIYGSLREKSINKALARAVQLHAPEGMETELMGVSGLPLSRTRLLALVVQAVVARGSSLLRVLKARSTVPAQAHKNIRHS